MSTPSTIRRPTNSPGQERQFTMCFRRALYSLKWLSARNFWRWGRIIRQKIKRVSPVFCRKGVAPEGNWLRGCDDKTESAGRLEGSMKTKLFAVLAAVVILLMVSSPMFAHHGGVQYDKEHAVTVTESLQRPKQRTAWFS